MLLPFGFTPAQLVLELDSECIDGALLGLVDFPVLGLALLLQLRGRAFVRVAGMPALVAALLFVECFALIGVLLLKSVIFSLLTRRQLTERPPRPIEHIAVVAPPAFIAALASESAAHSIFIEDGNVIVPPTRHYKDAEIRQLLATRGVDGVFVVSVTGDTGLRQRYASTIFSGNYSGTSLGNAVLTGNPPLQSSKWSQATTDDEWLARR
jgi:hypothetical protein